MSSKQKKTSSERQGLGKWINKYSIAAVCFVVWISFLDQYNLISQFKLNRIISNLEKQKVEYMDLVEESEKLKAELDANPEYFARKYCFVHKPNETIVILEREEK